MRQPDMDTSPYRSDCTDHFRTTQDRTIDFSDSTRFTRFCMYQWLCSSLLQHRSVFECLPEASASSQSKHAANTAMGCRGFSSRIAVANKNSHLQSSGRLRPVLIVQIGEVLSQAVWTNTMGEVRFRMSTHVLFNSHPAPDIGSDLLTVRADRQKPMKCLNFTHRGLQFPVGRF